MSDRILLIDDDEELGDVLGLVLERAGYSVEIAQDHDLAMAKILSGLPYSAFLVDLRLGDRSGLALVPEILESHPNSPILMITAHGDVDSAVEGFKLGISGYIKKPFQDGELILQIGQAIENARLKSSIEEARLIRATDCIRTRILSRDPAFEAVYKRVAIAAQVNSPVVIQGESGTGKELVARALHSSGPRKDGPFIAFNCGALPENLAEAELFGYMRGAFTDARENKPGLFVRANGGTLFLDEIADASPTLQTKLLRVIQEKEVTPLGGTHPIKVDVRIISASHKSLQRLVELGQFRQDLFYRLHVVPIHLPALRARQKDILFIAAIHAKRLAEQLKIGFDGFTAAAEKQLLAHGWPGNVRELHNRIEHAMVVLQGGRLSARSLFPEMELEGNETDPVLLETVEPSVEDALPSFFEAKVSFERTYLERVLKAAQGNIARASRLASKSRTEVYSLLKKHGLDPESFK